MEPIGVLGDGCVLAWNPRRQRGPLEFAVFGVQGRVGLLRKFGITLAPNEAAEKVILSPDGTALAWVIHNYPDYPNWLISLASQLHIHLPLMLPRAEIRVSNLDGTGMCRLGYADLVATDRDAYYIANELRWLPDSRRIGFEYRGGYWAISTK